MATSKLAADLVIKPRGRLLRCMSPQLADIVAKVGEGRLGRNNRIATRKSLNQPCVSRADLESMLLPRIPKIFLQKYRPISDALEVNLRVRLPRVQRRFGAKCDCKSTPAQAS
jgi:hypothetical protein